MTEQELALEPTPAHEGIRWTVQILLPESADRELQRKTNKTPGASWPAWGGHVTLLPTFTTPVDEDTLQEAVSQAVAGAGQIEIVLSNFTVERDLTRPDYCAVFLTLGEGQEQALQQLRSLRERIYDATRTIRTDKWPALEGGEFVPHVTLAMGLSEAEADAVVRTLRAEGLSVRFRLKEILLLGFDGGGTEPSRAFAFPLSARKEEASGEKADAGTGDAEAASTEAADAKESEEQEAST